jgi:hypothetical protein
MTKVTVITAPSRVVITNARTVVSVKGIAGVKGDKGNGSLLKMRFSWGDAMPLVIFTAPANKVICSVEVVLQTAFDAVSSISIGDAGDHERLFRASSVDTSTAASYEENPNYTYQTATDIAIYLTAGAGVTSGSGIIFIYIED